MQTDEETRVLSYLADVAHLYENYVELAGLARVPTQEELDDESPQVPGIAPLGLCIRAATD